MDRYWLALDDFRDDTTFDYAGKDFMFAGAAKTLPARMLRSVLDFETVLFCRKGNVSVRMEGGEPLRLGRGQILICPDGKTISDFRASGDAEIVIFCYTWEIMEATISGGSLLWPLVDYIGRNPVITPKEPFAGWLEARLPYLRYISKSDNTMLKDELLLAFTKIHLCELVRMVADRLREAAPQDTSRANELTRRFFDILVAGHGSLRSVAEIAAEMSISAKYLSRVVKEETGGNAMAIVRSYVMRAIGQELKYRNKSLKEIAFSLNFPTPAAFSKYIKTQTGLSATEYRQKLRSEDWGRKDARPGKP